VNDLQGRCRWRNPAPRRLCRTRSSSSRTGSIWPSSPSSARGFYQESLSQTTLREVVLVDVRNRLTQERGLATADRDRLVQEIADDTLGHGPIEPLLNDDSVTEVMVNGPDSVWVERAGRLEKTHVRFSDDHHLRRIINKIVAQVGRRVDESSPMVDARLPDGSRVTRCCRRCHSRGHC